MPLEIRAFVPGDVRAEQGREHTDGVLRGCELIADALAIACAIPDS
jgi:hypothetical protein